jgi:hypothetical protein
VRNINHAKRIVCKVTLFLEGVCKDHCVAV